MKPYHLALLLTLAVGCKSGDGFLGQEFKVGGHSLTVKDSGYVTADYFCAGAAQGQMRLNIVDYQPICGGAVPASADGGSRDPTLEHNELELILVISANDNPKVAFDVSPPDCVNGPAGPGIANFMHYPSGSTTPDITIAQGGQIFLTSYDKTDAKPATGNFDLDFGGAQHVVGKFETYTCN